MKFAPWDSGSIDGGSRLHCWSLLLERFWTATLLDVHTLALDGAGCWWPLKVPPEFCGYQFGARCSARVMKIPKGWLGPMPEDLSRKVVGLKPGAGNIFQLTKCPFLMPTWIILLWKLLIHMCEMYQSLPVASEASKWKIRSFDAGVSEYTD